MRDPCEIVVYVRSRHILAEAREERCFLTVSYVPGASARVPVRTMSLRYRRHLDREQSLAVESARLLAASGAFPVRVVDLGRMSPPVRFLRTRLLRVRSVPVVVVKGPCAWSSPETGGTPQVLRPLRAARPDRRTRASAGAS